MISQMKFEIIYSTINKECNVLSVSRLCEIANVSRSGYYSWVNSFSQRERREAKDKADFDLVLKAYKFRGYAKGARSIHMRLLHVGVCMNLKKIRRLMRKYGLKCPYRKPNPYRKMAKELRTNTTFKNEVNRKFVNGGIRKVLLTDITYIFYDGGVCYLSTILAIIQRLPL